MIKADLINKISLELNTPKQEPEEGPLFQAEQSPQGAHQQIMRYISAPWRADYVCRALPAKGGCVFCEAVKSRDDRASAPRVRGRAYAPPGCNAGMNIGASAGAGVAGHYHLHVVPRWTGDSNFMPLIGATKVFIEDLAQSYGKLRPLFDEEKRRRERAGRPRRRAAAPARATML